MNPGLKFGPIEPHSLHIAVDMQRLFAQATAWHTPTLHSIVPAIAAITAQHTANTVFTRFITAHNAEQAQGSWQRYYRHWHAVTGHCIDATLLDVVEPLQAFMPPAQVIDKRTHCAFESAEFRAVLTQKKPSTLIFTGVETDVCVLASVLTAVDKGYRVVVVSNAVTSSDLAAHQATLETLLPRFDQQIEQITTEQLLQVW